MLRNSIGWEKIRRNAVPMIGAILRLFVALCLLVGDPSIAAFSQPDGLSASAESGSGGGAGTPEADERPPTKMSGGPCEYKTYSGHAEILSVRLKELPKGYPGPPHDSYEVRFLFFPDHHIEEPSTQVEGKPQFLTPTNSRYPGPRFIKKYGIAEGQTFDCRLKVVTRGACTLMVFEFPAIDLWDYFESRFLQ